MTDRQRIERIKQIIKGNVMYHHFEDAIYGVIEEYRYKFSRTHGFNEMDAHIALEELLGKQNNDDEILACQNEYRGYINERVVLNSYSRHEVTSALKKILDDYTDRVYLDDTTYVTRYHNKWAIMCESIPILDIVPIIIIANTYDEMVDIITNMQR